MLQCLQPPHCFLGRFDKENSLRLCWIGNLKVMLLVSVPVAKVIKSLLAKIYLNGIPVGGPSHRASGSKMVLLGIIVRQLRQGNHANGSCSRKVHRIQVVDRRELES